VVVFSYTDLWSLPVTSFSAPACLYCGPPVCLFYCFLFRLCWPVFVFLYGTLWFLLSLILLLLLVSSVACCRSDLVFHGFLLYPGSLCSRIHRCPVFCVHLVSRDSPCSYSIIVSCVSLVLWIPVLSPDCAPVAPGPRVTLYRGQEPGGPKSWWILSVTGLWIRTRRSVDRPAYGSDRPVDSPVDLCTDRAPTKRPSDRQTDRP